MKNTEVVLSVKFNSSLSNEDLMKACQEDLDIFRKVPGLLQKYYIIEESSGAISGFYLFETKSARAAFWTSDLAKSIPVRYGVIPATLRVEQFDLAIMMNEPMHA